jgi:hypothetical protein
MAKTPCLDCIDKYEKTKQRKRKAKQRQKQKEQQASPKPVLPRSPYSGFNAVPPPKTNNLADLLAVLRVAETMKQPQNTPTLDSLERTPKPPPATPKPTPKTANEAISQVVDNYVGLLTSTVPSSVLSQTPAALAAPAIVTGQYVGGLLSTPFQFLGRVASSVGRAAAAAAEPEPEVRRSLQRTASAVGGTTPELQFIGSTGRILESSPAEAGANPLPSVFTAAAPPINLAADLQARRESLPVGRSPQLIPETETVDALGGGYAPLRHEEAERTVLDLALRPRVDFPLVPVAAGLTPETESLAPLEEQMTPEEEAEFADAIAGEFEEPLLEVPPTIETASSLATGEALEEAPLTAAGLGRSPRALERQTTEELAVSVEDVDTEELRAAAEKQKALDEEKRRQKEEARFQKRLDEIAKIENQQRREEAKARVAADKEAKRLEREQAKAEKGRGFTTNPREAAQYGRLLGAAAEIQPSQLALVEGPSSVSSSPLLIGAGLGLPPRSAGFTTYDVSPLTSQEEYEPITFTQPAARTFQPFEGGGV